MSTTFLETELVALKADYVKLRTGYTQALLSGVLSYTIDTGQDRNTATRYSLAESLRVQQSMLNEITMLESRLDGGNIVRAEPAF